MLHRNFRASRGFIYTGFPDFGKLPLGLCRDIRRKGEEHAPYCIFWETSWESVGVEEGS